ncbi:MAG: hypothetical protein KGN16_12185 [Burkholderiales bacterium]|nr:hypothetical protein [Burkholderiales bacterium]
MRFIVSDVTGHDIALLDSAGRRHAARLLETSLKVGVEVHGGHPVRGFAILTEPGTGRACPVVYESVGRRAAGSA